MQHIIDRFVSYVTIDTESDPNSDTTPSTKKQFDLANKLVEELKTIGLKEVTIDKHGYIMATLPSNVDHEVPTIGFISHFDTTPDFTGKDVKPQIIPNYDGGDIVLNKEQKVSFSLFDAMGRTVRGVVSKQFEPGINNFQFNLTNLPRGTYYIKINDGEQEINKLLVLE
jgi:di/tripeptidase